jgi:hypothetical protein
MPASYSRQAGFYASVVGDAPGSKARVTQNTPNNAKRPRPAAAGSEASSRLLLRLAGRSVLVQVVAQNL